MYTIQTLNAISDVIYAQLPAADYAVANAAEAPEGILVRSADMHSMTIPESVLGIARAGAGTNNIPCDDCAKKGIVVFNTPGANANAVAELVICGMMLASRNVVGGIEWAKTLKDEGDAVAKLVEKGKSKFVGPEIRGKKLGVIGLGAIGRIVANAACQGLGMDVLGCDPFISVDSAWALDRNIRHCNNNDEVYADADYITIHVPLNDKTKHMINADTIAKMKDGVRILNYARAELVDPVAMKAALESGKVAAYVTDFPTAPALDMPNCICIPHLGASTPESEDNCATMAAAQLCDYLEFGQIRNSVNMPDMPLGRNDCARLLIIHDNVPSMVSTIATVIGSRHINISGMTNKSRKEIAVTALDLDEMPTQEAIDEIIALPGVIRVRKFS